MVAKFISGLKSLEYPRPSKILQYLIITRFGGTKNIYIYILVATLPVNTSITKHDLPSPFHIYFQAKESTTIIALASSRSTLLIFYSHALTTKKLNTSTNTWIPKAQIHHAIQTYATRIWTNLFEIGLMQDWSKFLNRICRRHIKVEVNIS